MPASESLGRSPAELHPSVGGEAEVLHREVMPSGRPRRDVLPTGAIGSRPRDVRHWNASSFPVRQADEVIGSCVVVADVTTEHRLTVALAASEEAHRRLAEDLQRSLLPHALPVRAGTELGNVYRPGGVAAAVGGDSYDLVELDDASGLLVMGDVEGTGPAAASLTAAARYAIRATAVRTTDPAELLLVAHEVLLRQGTPNGTCTVACVLATRVGEHTELRAASAGHPLPLVVRGESGGASTPAGAAEIARTVESAVATSESGHPADDLAVLVLEVPAGD